MFEDNISISWTKYKKKKLRFWTTLILLIFVVYIGFCTYVLISDKQSGSTEWNNHLNEANTYTQTENEIKTNAVEIKTGTYIEGIQSLNLKSSSYTVIFEVWFKWQGDKILTMADNFSIYNGTVESCEIVKDYHNGNDRYQRMKIKATVYQNFSIRRFPLGSYQLRLYVCPKKSVESVYFTPDTKNSGINNDMKISGFKASRNAVGLYIHRDSGSKSDPEISNSDNNTSAELLTMLEVSRNSFGLYFKCVIALIGTSVWAFLTLFICTYHNVDSLNMIPAVLFGTMSNILVGANLVPDAMDAGLLEYINIWGIYTILIITVVIINVNNLRNNQQHKDPMFARHFGRVMFTLLLITTVLGHIILPLTAYFV